MNHEVINQTAKNIAALEPGFLPKPIFQEIARLVAVKKAHLYTGSKYKNRTKAAHFTTRIVYLNY